MKTKTDWVSWILHGFVGAIGGVLIGIFAIYRKRYGFIINSDLVPGFLLGAALIGAGVGSICGDQLWLRNCYTRYPQEVPAATLVSKTLSGVMIFAGIGMMVWSFIEHAW
jgi:hypothetical protein